MKANKVTSLNFFKNSESHQQMHIASNLFTHLEKKVKITFNFKHVHHCVKEQVHENIDKNATKKS